MATKVIRAQSPARIDLAGGTTDLWPLYLFLNHPVTLNLGISLFAEAVLEISSLPAQPDVPAVRLCSKDQKTEAHFSWQDLAAEQMPKSLAPGLQLHFKLLRYFTQKMMKHGIVLQSLPSLVMSTSAQSPAGAGLGGSSTLSIAIVGGLANWAAPLLGESAMDPEAQGEDFIEIVRDIETTVIGVPAGMQDYYGAMFGGLQSLHWKPGKNTRTAHPTELLSQLDQRLLLFYSGQSRNSGINNWELFKRFIDGHEETRMQFQKISDATHTLTQALLVQDWQLAAQAISNEWTARKTLADGISTPEIDRALDAAQKIAPIAGKICGAGGGGCFFIFIPESDAQILKQKREQIELRVVAQGLRALPFHSVPNGLTFL